MSLSRTLRSLVSILVILGIGLPLWYLEIAHRPEPPTAPLREVGPVPVETRPVAAADAPLVVEAYGTLEPRAALAIAFEVGGRLERIHAGWEPGAPVAEGEVLAALDPHGFDLEVRAARAAIEELEARKARAETESSRAEDALLKADEMAGVARDEWERLDRLEREGVVPETGADQARMTLLRAELDARNARGALESSAATLTEVDAALLRAQATLDQALDAKAKSVLTAPFSGRFAGRAPAAGSLVVPGQLLGELLDVSTLRLELRVMEDDLPGLAPGLAARVSLPSRPSVDVEARLVGVSPRADPISRSAPVELEVRGDALGEPLAAGLFALARIEVAVMRGAIRIERRELRWEVGEPVAYVAVGPPGSKRAQRRPLVLGRILGEGFAVESGLAAGELLVTGPLDRMRDEVPIEPRGGAGGAVESPDPVDAEDDELGGSR